MGMDVYGNNPNNETGEYFRANVWWWRPLADYCLSVAPDVCSNCEHWHSNDGDGLDESSSALLAEALREEISEGRTALFEKKYDAEIAAMPLEECKWCHGTGTRSDSVGQSNGMTDKVIDEPDHPRNGQKGWCNGCKGRGEKEQWAASYPFSAEFVGDFAEFVANSGGFKIC